jgi:hypothetical protein
VSTWLRRDQTVTNRPLDGRPGSSSFFSVVSLPSPARRLAPLARAIAFLTVAVVVVRDVARGSSLLGLLRAVWRAIVPSATRTAGGAAGVAHRPGNGY